MVSTADVMQAVSGIDLPKSKQEVVDYAKKKGASGEVMSALQKLPERQYEDATDITEAMGEMEEM